MAFGSGVDECGGVCRRGGGRLCGYNDKSSNSYITSSIHRYYRLSVSGTTGGSGARVGYEIGGGAHIMLVSVAVTWCPSHG
jgi:hypothetical protein